MLRDKLTHFVAYSDSNFYSKQLHETACETSIETECRKENDSA